MKYKSINNDKSGSFKDFPERLKMARLKMGETQKEFGNRLGVAHNTVGNWERGDRQMPYDAIWILLMELDMLKENQEP